MKRGEGTAGGSSATPSQSESGWVARTAGEAHAAAQATPTHGKGGGSVSGSGELRVAKSSDGAEGGGGGGTETEERPLQGGSQPAGTLLPPSAENSPGDVGATQCDVVWRLSPADSERVPFSRLNSRAGRNVDATQISSLLRKASDKRKAPSGTAKTPTPRLPGVAFDATQAAEVPGSASPSRARRALGGARQQGRLVADGDALAAAMAAVEDAARSSQGRSARKRSALKRRRRGSGLGLGSQDRATRTRRRSSGGGGQRRRQHVLDLLDELEGVMEERHDAGTMASRKVAPPASPNLTPIPEDAPPQASNHPTQQQPRPTQATATSTATAQAPASVSGVPAAAQAPPMTRAVSVTQARQLTPVVRQQNPGASSRVPPAVTDEQTPAASMPASAAAPSAKAPTHQAPGFGTPLGRTPRPGRSPRPMRVREATPARGTQRAREAADPFEDSEDILAQMLDDIEAERQQKQQALGVAPHLQPPAGRLVGSAPAAAAQQQQQQELPCGPPAAYGTPVPERFRALGAIVTGQVELQLEEYRGAVATLVERHTWTCVVRDAWAESAAPLEPGDCMMVLSPRVERGPTGQAILVVDACDGLLVTHPHVLLSGSRVGASFPCPRRSVLQESVKYPEGDRTAAITGTMLHELFQGVIAEGVDAADLEVIAMNACMITQRNSEQLHAAGVTTKDVLEKMQRHYHPIADWTQTFLAPDRRPMPVDFGARSGPDGFRVERVADIEESVHSARLGLKGQVDATLYGQVMPAPPGQAARQGRRGAAAPGPRNMVMPLEFKTGKPKHDEHRAQVILYSLMLQERYGAAAPPDGVLLYSNPPSMRGVRPSRGDVIALMCRRNLLATKLRPGAGVALALPPVAGSEIACRWCRSQPECMVSHAVFEEGGPESSGVPGIYNKQAAHLADAEKAFVRHWITLIEMEAKGDGDGAVNMLPWTMPPGPRSEGGLRLLADNSPGDGGLQGSDRMLGGRYVYTFMRHAATVSSSQSSGGGAAALRCNLSDGDYIMVSAQPPRGAAIPMLSGLVRGVPGTTITVALRRPLTAAPGGPKREHTEWRIDRQLSGPIGVPTMRGNIMRLVAPGGTPDGDTAARLRQLVVHLRAPSFAPPLPVYSPEAISQQAWASSLNEDQLRAVGHVMRTEEYSLVQGMPGTGKSATIAACIRALVLSGKRVLLTCHTHSAVDQLLERLLAPGDGLPVLRVGREERVSEKVRPHTLAAVSGDPAKLAAIVERARVVACTCLGAADDFFARQRFDVCMVDEAGQLSLPIILGPLLLARRFVLVGDLNQLPPLVKSEAARERGLGTSLFETLARAQPTAVVALSLQYRMAADIMHLANTLVYEGRLRCGSEEVAGGRLRLQLPPPPPGGLPEWLKAVTDADRRVVFLDTTPLGEKAFEQDKREKVAGEEGRAEKGRGERLNTTEVAVVASSLHHLRAAGLERGEAVVITPYRAQEEAIAQRLAADGSNGFAEVITVDKSQGRDCACVVVSFVRANAMRRARGLLSDWRRVNVLLTRAQRKLVLVGCAHTLASEPLAERLLALCRDRGQVVPVAQLP